MSVAETIALKKQVVELQRVIEAEEQATLEANRYAKQMAESVKQLRRVRQDGRYMLSMLKSSGVNAPSVADCLPDMATRTRGYSICFLFDAAVTYTKKIQRVEDAVKTKE